MGAVAGRTDIGPPKIVAIALDTDYKPPLRGVRNGAAAAGDISVVNTDGTSIVMTNVQPGETIKGTIQRVNTSGTTVGTPTTYLQGLQ